MPASPHRRARLQATIAALLALGLWWWLRGLFATGVLIVAGALAALAWLAPRAHAPVQRVLERAGHALAIAVSWCLLGAAYFGMFVPLRLWRALMGRDTLRLRPDPVATTYLEPVRKPRPRRFERMY